MLPKLLIPTHLFPICFKATQDSCKISSPIWRGRFLKAPKK